MKNTRAKFDRELELFKQITKVAKTGHRDMSYPLPVWKSPESRLDEDFMMQFDYQITLLKAQAGSAIKKSFDKFSAVSRSLGHFKGAFFGDTTLDLTSSQNEVSITLRTPFRMVWRSVPVSGEISCSVSMKRIYEYARTGGPSVRLMADLNMFDEYDDRGHIDIWIREQSMEDVFTEFKKKLNECVSGLKQHSKLFAKMKAKK
jgi:hypothetical protein